MRKFLARKLLFVGGLAGLPGFQARVFQEIEHLLINAPRYTPLQGSIIPRNPQSRCERRVIFCSFPFKKALHTHTHTHHHLAQLLNHLLARICTHTYETIY
jgi:hypothetical protein